ncbi:hypothetical protein KQH82_06225 [bacterium]|nr:hypothetical protein [bacterium]
MIELTKERAATAESCSRLAAALSNALERGDWNRLSSLIEKNQRLSQGLSTTTIQRWVERSERSGRYDVAEYLIEILPSSERGQAWYQETRLRTRCMNLAPSRLPLHLRTPELTVIDAVRDNDFSTLNAVLASQEDRRDELVDLAEDVNCILHVVWDKLTEKKERKKSVRIGDIERESSLSKQYIRYLLRDWVDEE